MSKKNVTYEETKDDVKVAAPVELISNVIPAVNPFKETIKVALLDLESVKAQLESDLFKRDALGKVARTIGALKDLVKE